MKARIKFLLLLSFICGWSLLLYFVGAERLVRMIGVENGYLIVLCVALFGGMSAIGGVVYVTTLVTFASAGLSPLWLALASGAGVSFGDTLFFYLGKHGRSSIKSGYFHDLFTKLSNWLKQRSEATVVLFAYIYSGFTPFPSDFLAIMLGALKQRYIIAVPTLVVGNITFAYLLAKFGGVVSL